MSYTTKRQMRQTGKRCPNYQDLFSLDDINLAKRVRATHNPGLSRIVVCANEQKYDTSGSIYKDTDRCLLHCYTLKLKYALEVWSKAVLKSSLNPGDMLYYWWIKWADNDTSFKHLEYHKFYRDITVDQLLKGFWSLLEEIADSGEVTVKEGYHNYFVESSFDWEAAPKIHCDVIIDAESGRKVYEAVFGKWPESKEITAYEFDYSPRTYRWEDIKDMFIELTLDQLRLVQRNKMHKCNSIDKILFDACSRLDIEGVRRAIELGANVNALDKHGNSPVSETIEDTIYNYLDIDKRYTDEEYQEIKDKTLSHIIPILQLLIEHGADVDLFGYDGKQPLLAAYYAGSPEITEFLLKMGSNPNYNSYLDDITSDEEKACVSSTVLDCLYDEIDDYTPEQLAIEKLVYQYGGRHLNWGHTHYPWEYIGKYVVTLEPYKDGDPFYDCCHVAIGNDKSIIIEREDGEIIDINISSVSGFTEWLSQYHHHYNDMTYDWNGWRNRGLVIAKEISVLLPDYVSLRYLTDSKVLFGQTKDKSCMYYHTGEPIIIK